MQFYSPIPDESQGIYEITEGSNKERKMGSSPSNNRGVSVSSRGDSAAANRRGIKRGGKKRREKGGKKRRDEGKGDGRGLAPLITTLSLGHRVLNGTSG